VLIQHNSRASQIAASQSKGRRLKKIIFGEGFPEPARGPAKHQPIPKKYYNNLPKISKNKIFIESL
jgi:hypothetical protein